MILVYLFWILNFYKIQKRYTKIMKNNLQLFDFGNLLMWIQPGIIPVHGSSQVMHWKYKNSNSRQSLAVIRNNRMIMMFWGRAVEIAPDGTHSSSLPSAIEAINRSLLWFFLQMRMSIFHEIWDCTWLLFLDRRRKQRINTCVNQCGWSQAGLRPLQWLFLRNARKYPAYKRSFK